MANVNNQEVTSDYRLEFQQSQATPYYYVNGNRLSRRKYEGADLCTCLATYNQFHHVGCDNEDCPLCGDKINRCGCLTGD